MKWNSNSNCILLLCSMSSIAIANESSLQDLVSIIDTAPETVIYTAKEIITLDRKNSSAQSVAVENGKVLAVGALDDVKSNLHGKKYTVNNLFSDKVIVPGFIAQHDHPLLAALTMSSVIIAIEDWVLPDGVSKAAKNHGEYIEKLNEANDNIQNTDELLLTWGYHQYFHGPLTKKDLDAISLTRPIIVWHRSGHEFYLNSVAEKKFGITPEWYSSLSKSAKEQSDFNNGHYWEQGGFAIMPKIAAAIASPERVRKGLEFVKLYYHTNGVTLGAEPGGMASKKAQDAQNAVLSDTSSPFRFYYIADGKSITGTYQDNRVAAETAKLLTWGQGMTSYLPHQVKLFADGAIYSQAMQLTGGYNDGHEGAWMMDPDFFSRSFRVYWDLDYQIHVHVNGDAGLDLVLDQLELNLQRHPRNDHRTVIVHFGISRTDQVARIRKLGAIVSGNPYYPVALADNYRVNGLDPERADSMVRMGDVERAGISYSFHSDMPMAPGQPLFLMWAGVNRITNDGHVRGADQKVSQLGALKAVTLDAAYSLQLEKQVGSIEPGKLANFTILSDNPVTIKPEKINSIEVWGTVLEGRVQPVENGGYHMAALGPDINSVINNRAFRKSVNFHYSHAEYPDACGIAKELSALIY